MSNFHQVKAIQTNIERKVDRDGLREEYDREMQRMIDVDVISLLTDQEMRLYEGGVHYMPHFGVVNPESKSTKLQIVVNSSTKNSKTGLSFNDLIELVPNGLNDPLTVIQRWRFKKKALNYDLSKAYHFVRTGQKEIIYRFRNETQ